MRARELLEVQRWPGRSHSGPMLEGVNAGLWVAVPRRALDTDLAVAQRLLEPLAAAVELAAITD